VPETYVEDVEPHHLGQALRRFWAVVLVLTVLVAAAATAYASSRAEVYSSSARILLRPSVGNPFNPETGSSGQQVTIAMQTEAALVDSGPVLALVNAKLTPDTNAKAITVTVPPNTQTVLITAESSTPAHAQAVAQILAESYLGYRKSLTETTSKARVDQLNKQIASVKTALAAAAKAASNDTSNADSSRQLQVLTERLISLQDSLSDAQSISSDPGTLVTPASLPTKPSGLDSKLYIAAGAVVGFFAGVALALWLGRRDKRIHARSSASVAGLPVLAVFGSQRRDRVIADKQAYQRLRTAVLASSAVPSAVAVSGVGKRDRSGGVAFELGRSMTRAGYRVVVVMTTPDDESSGLDAGRAPHGLADVLRERDANVLSFIADQEGLKVLPCGSGIREVEELLSGERFAHIVGELKENFDYVLVVTGPASLPAELATARLTDALLLVGHDQRTTRVEVAEVGARASLVGLRVTGLALLPRREPSQPKPVVEKSAALGSGERPGARTRAAEAGTPSGTSDRHDVPLAQVSGPADDSAAEGTASRSER
jgi:capsular polysaccharide biosynthesis protein